MASPIPGSWRGVVKRYNNTSKEVQAYFANVPTLIEQFDWEVPLGFMFTRVEKAHNTMLYCGAVKRHRANTEVARNFVDRHHMTRREFRRLFKNVFGKPIKPPLQRMIEEAEAVRDKVVHGKRISAAEQRKAIVRVLEYSEAMNDLVCEIAGFKPFTNDLRGFKGRRAALDKSTTTWLMRGLGFGQKKPDEDEAG
jgi:AraC-like DNA-binding protein